MTITEVRVRLAGDRERNDRIAAYANITIDDTLVVKELRVIEGPTGLMVAMPSRKLTDRCPACSGKNPLLANYCNRCGHRLGDDRAPRDADGRARLHADTAHPINPMGRAMIEDAVLEEYGREVERSAPAAGRRARVA